MIHEKDKELWVKELEPESQLEVWRLRKILLDEGIDWEFIRIRTMLGLQAICDPNCIDRRRKLRHKSILKSRENE